MTAEQHDPGGRSIFAMPVGMRGGAIISECGRYRLLLWREWNDKPFPRTALWIGTNPSTATGNRDDRTVRREVDFTQRFGFSRYLKANVMNYRVTDPKVLTRPGIRPCSPDNLATIRQASEEAALIVLAFGKLPKQLASYAAAVIHALQGSDKELYVIGRNQDGSPKHPLYVRRDATLMPF
jgi:hypothetical protein